MFEAARMMYLYVESPLHAGTGRGLGAVDLPIQRERITGYPLVQASGIKGALRSECEIRSQDKTAIKFVFGPPTTNASDHAGAVSPGDARLLLFPVRSLAGVFAWTTSVDALARFQRDLIALGVKPTWTIPPAPASGVAWVTKDASVIASDKVVLEEFSFTVDKAHADPMTELAKWIADQAFPRGDEYAYWRTKISSRLVILHEDAFRDFTQFATEVLTRVKLGESKTVEEGPWTEECLPVDTLLYAPIAAAEVRRPKPKTKDDVDPRPFRKGREALDFVARHLDATRIQLGGDETVGRGTVSLRFGEVKSLNGKGG